MKLETLKKIVEAAVMAPTGDNCQPLRFEWDGRSLEIFDCPDRGEAFLNLKNFGTCGGLGTTLENIDVAAQFLGWKTQLHLFPDGSSENLLVRVSFQEDQKVETPLFAQIPKRCTNRKPYKKNLIPVEMRKEILDLNEFIKDVNVFFTEDKHVINLIAKGMGLAERIVTFNKLSHADLFWWIRWTKKEKESTRDGMPAETFELNPIDLVNMKLFEFWTWTNFVGHVGGDRIMAFMRERLYRHSPGFGVISVPEWNRENITHAGVVMERIWLKATQHHLAFHGTFGVPFLGYILRACPEGGFRSQHLKQAQNVISQIEAKWPEYKKMAPVFLFRIGEAPPPSGRSLRRSVEDVLTIRGSQDGE